MPTQITARLKELQAARAKVAALEEAYQAELKKELAALPAKFGFSSAEEFTAAVRAASGGRRAGRPAKAAGKRGGRRRRAVITEETRGQVKKLVESGKTGAEIARQLSISLPSVQNIKKALGLVKKR